MRVLRGLAVAAGVVLGGLAPARGEPVTAAPATPAAPPLTPADTAEPPINVPGAEGDYLRTLHTRIHWRWAHNFIEGVAMAAPAGAPLNNPALAAEVLFTIRWDGSPAEVTLSKSSGQKAFDQAAAAAVRGDSRYPVPPLALFGDDGVAHFRWSFARDHRLCSDGELRRREDSLEDALPRLFIQGRLKEALLRVQRYMERGDANAMSVFAKTWLQRPLVDKVADIHAAAALARLGDRRQLPRLRPGLGRAETVAVTARALGALKVDLCAELDPALRAREPAAFELAIAALREVGSAPPGSPCLATLAALVDDEAAPKALRASALRTFAALDYAGARKRSIELLESGSPDLRAAAAQAFARPGGGRPSLYRLEPMVKDGNAEVRAAVAAALVRASGELSFDYLQPLFKSNDNRPFLAMAPALGALSSAASVDLVVKILKRGPELQEPYLRALANRKDDKGRALFKPMAEAAKKNWRTPHELKLFLYAAAPIEEVMPLLKDPYLGIIAYKALLRAKRHKEAAEWLVARFDHLSPEVLGDAFGAWLANPPSGLAAQ